MKPFKFTNKSKEVETVNELSKSTLGSYVKKAAVDSVITRKLAADFEHRGKRAKKQGMKDAAASISNDYRDRSYKRQDNINKAVDRLTNESAELDRARDEAEISRLRAEKKKHDREAAEHESHTAKHTADAKLHKARGDNAYYHAYNDVNRDRSDAHKQTITHLHGLQANKEHEKNMDVKRHLDKKQGEVNIQNKQELSKIINKTISKKLHTEEKDPREYDYEGDMSKGYLRSIIANAQAVHDMLDDNTNMAEWVQSKITLAADYISTVKNYVTSETNEEIKMKSLHPNALHVKPVKTATGTKYQVHAVGKNFSSGIKKGEHLSDTELDDFHEMGGKIKHIKESSLSEILEMAVRGRPKKEDDEEDDHLEDKGPEANQNIHMQLKRAIDGKSEKGGADVHFENGKKHFVKSEHAQKVVSALEKLKPADRAEAASHVYKSHENFKSIHSMLK